MVMLGGEEEVVTWMTKFVKGKGRGKGKGNWKKPKKEGPSGPDLPRESVSENLSTGVVTAWRGKMGWIKPNNAIDHPQAKKRGGKLFVSKTDLLNDAEKLEVNAQVTFTVY